MANTTRYNISTGSLLNNTNRVDAPFIKVTINGYSFGVYQGASKVVNSKGVVSKANPVYPNYVQDLTIKKINGIVNQYSLVINYPITADSDPNFFEKLFSSASQKRKIHFEYGDSLQPNYIYKDEEAIITDVKTSFNMKASNIQYTVSAVSASKLSLSGSYTFPKVEKKPSEVIYDILYSNKYKLLDVFTGMLDKSVVIKNNLIASDDKKVLINTCTGMSALEYISYLVSCMVPNGANGNEVVKSNYYALTTYESVEGDYVGPYFRVDKVQSAGSNFNDLCTYTVDIGYPTANIVTDFRLEDDQNWAIFYNYNMDSNDSLFRSRIDNEGNLVKEYVPLLTNSKYQVTSADEIWWTKVTQYPIKATITLKGLLRPVVLMKYIKINTWFYGHKHISSGYYLISGQTDKIGLSGYTTTLELVRVGADEEMF